MHHAKTFHAGSMLQKKQTRYTMDSCTSVEQLD